MYWKGILSLLTCFCLWLFALGVTPASDGGELFADRCLACHRQQGEAVPVSPADKAAFVWEKYFKRDRHPGKLSAMLQPEEQKIILQYLKDHAADSDSPDAAALPR